MENIEGHSEINVERVEQRERSRSRISSYLSLFIFFAPSLISRENIEGHSEIKVERVSEREREEQA